MAPSIGRRWWCAAAQTIGLQLQVCLDVAMVSDQLGMAKPESNDLESDASLEQCHGTKGPKCVGRYPAVRKGRAPRRSVANSQRKAESDAVTA